MNNLISLFTGAGQDDKRQAVAPLQSLRDKGSADLELLRQIRPGIAPSGEGEAFDGFADVVDEINRRRIEERARGEENPGEKIGGSGGAPDLLPPVEGDDENIPALSLTRTAEQPAPAPSLDPSEEIARDQIVAGARAVEDRGGDPLLNRRAEGGAPPRGPLDTLNPSARESSSVGRPETVERPAPARTETSRGLARISTEFAANGVEAPPVTRLSPSALAALQQNEAATAVAQFAARPRETGPNSNPILHPGLTDPDSSFASESGEGDRPAQAPSQQQGSVFAVQAAGAVAAGAGAAASGAGAVASGTGAPVSGVGQGTPGGPAPIHAAGANTGAGSGGVNGGVLPSEGAGISQLARESAPSVANALDRPAQTTARNGAVTEQVAQQIHRAVRIGNDRVTIQLKPHDLGRIDVRLDIAQDGRVEAVIQADNEKTLQLLLQDARELTRALQNAGLQLADPDLSFGLLGEGTRYDIDGKKRDDEGQQNREEGDDLAAPASAFVGGEAPIVIDPEEGLDIRV